MKLKTVLRNTLNLGAIGFLLMGLTNILWILTNNHAAAIIITIVMTMLAALFTGLAQAQKKSNK